MINLRWESLREVLANQQRIMLTMNTQDNEKLHWRVTIKANIEQQKIFDVLNLKSDILGRKKVKTRKHKICSANLTS